MDWNSLVRKCALAILSGVFSVELRAVCSGGRTWLLGLIILLVLMVLLAEIKSYMRRY